MNRAHDNMTYHVPVFPHTDPISAAVCFILRGRLSTQGKCPLSTHSGMALDFTHKHTPDAPLVLMETTLSPRLTGYTLPLILPYANHAIERR